MFVDERSLIKVIIHYKTGKSMKGLRVETDLEKIPEDKRAGYQSVTFEMKPITWKMSNDLMRECRYKNMTTMIDEIDWIGYKEKKLKLIIAGWDFKTPEGQAVPVSEEAVMHLHPLIAETLLSSYDKEAYLEEDSKE